MYHTAVVIPSKSSNSFQFKNTTQVSWTCHKMYTDLSYSNNTVVHVSSILRLGPVVVPLLFPALLESLHLHVVSLVLPEWVQSVRIDNYLLGTRPPILLLIETVVQLSVLLCASRAEDPRVPAPNVSQHSQLQSGTPHKRTTHRAHHRPRRYHQPCGHFRRWTYCQ